MAISIEEAKKKIEEFETKEKKYLSLKETYSKEIAILENDLKNIDISLQKEYGTTNMEEIKKIILNLDDEIVQLEEELSKIETQDLN